MIPENQHRPINRLAKLGISAGYWAAVSLWRGICRLAGSPAASRWTILYYHAVSDEQRQAFAAQMDLVTRLTTPISLGQIPPSESGKRFCSITFDDGFENAIRNAVPELAQRNIPATIFVTSGWMGKNAGWWPEAAPECSQTIASVEQFLALPGDLISLASHTVTHPRLPLLNEVEAKREVTESRTNLERVFQRQITLFSFPYGEFTEQLIRWCREAGYTRVYTTLPANALADPQAFAVGRVPAEPGDWALEYRLKLLGAYDWLPYAINFKRRCAALLRGKADAIPSEALQKSAAVAKF